MEFNHVSQDYDTGERTKRAEKIAEQLLIQWKDREKSPKIMLDFGCGTGLTSFALRHHCSEDALFYGYDPSSGMREQFLRKSNAIPTDRVHFIDDLNASSLQFDCIFSSLVFHHVSNVEETIKLLVSKLNPDGLLMIIDLDKDNGNFHRNILNYDGHNGFDRQWLCAQLQETGLIHVTSLDCFQAERTDDQGTYSYSLFCVAGEKPKINSCYN